MLYINIHEILLRVDFIIVTYADLTFCNKFNTYFLWDLGVNSKSEWKYTKQNRKVLRSVSICLGYETLDQKKKDNEGPSQKLDPAVPLQQRKVSLEGLLTLLF